jgi:hypothetical protein
MSAPENYILKFLTVLCVSSDSIVKGIIVAIIKTAVKTAEVDEQKTKRKHELEAPRSLYFLLLLVTQIIKGKQLFYKM